MNLFSELAFLLIIVIIFNNMLIPLGTHMIFWYTHISQKYCISEFEEILQVN